MKQIALFFVVSILLLGLANCDKKTNEPDAPTPTPEKILISEAFASGTGLLIQYYAYEDLFVGYNKIYLAVKDSASGEKLDNEIALEILPLMDMGMTIHSCPIEALEYDAENKLYEGAVVYVMPSTETANWTLDVNINSSTATLFIDVIQPEEAKLLSFQSQLDSTAFYFVSLIEPVDPKVGENAYQILINRRASMMNWPYEPYLTVEIEPEMPAMNHGSPNNVNPTHIGMGHYSGVVNFTMTGWWKVNMIIKDGEGSVLSDDIAFDITF